MYKNSDISESLFRLSLFCFLVICYCENAQKFTYAINDTMIVKASSVLELSLGLMTAADEYLSDASIEIQVVILQTGPVFPFDLLIFNYGQDAGVQCYASWVNNGLISSTLACTPTIDILLACMNYTNCTNENITYNLRLSQANYTQNLAVINNRGNTTIILQTRLQMQLSSQNTWFYWGVGLTCLLLINLVILTGTVFYWSLKYKKVKKMYEQFKLTVQGSQKVQ